MWGRKTVNLEENYLQKSQKIKLGQPFWPRPPHPKIGQSPIFWGFFIADPLIKLGLAKILIKQVSLFFLKI